MENDEKYELPFEGMKMTVTSDSDEPADEYLETSSISSGEESEMSCHFDNIQNFDDDMYSLIQSEEEDTYSMNTFKSYKFEENSQVLENLLNEEFKPYVAQLLRFFDISNLEADGESWVDIVTSLAWKAASFVRPDELEENARNLNKYVKITCVASGSRSQSHLVQGMVFKKHAVHKHMITEFKKPRLLLVRGSLGQSSSGLISFGTILRHYEEQQLMTLAQCLKNSLAHVILVEKTVSRDLVELILRSGLTIVSNMKLHRLERVARCTASTISSVDTSIVGQCNRVVFQKILEEHTHTRKSFKTLLFIEGCPTRLGCTILLMGSHSEELKKIKRVVRTAVFKAYHLIREASFRMALNAMFSSYVGESVYIDSQSASVSRGDEQLVCSEESQASDASCSTVSASSRDARKGVLMTILNTSRGIVCDHGSCFHTNFTLGKYIRDSLLNQNLKCKTCRENVEAHIYYYAYKKQQLAVRVQNDKYLARAYDQRVWLWSLCGKCELDNQNSNSPKRVLISEEALGLPFGRFLELHFLEPSPFDFPSVCGHSPHKDLLLFIGCGSMSAVFKYSPMGSSEIWEGSDSRAQEFANVLPLLGMLMSCCERKHKDL